MLYASVDQYTYDVTSLPTDQQAGDLAVGWYWWFPLAYLKAKVGADSPVYQFWCKACNVIWQPTTYKKDTLCTQPTPVYPCHVTASFTYQDQMCSFGYQWLYSAFFAETCGTSEGPCYGT